MKKFLTILPLVCISVSAFAEIAPDDKVFFFYASELSSQFVATFHPKNPYALRAAQKYAELMDSNGLVSLSDLRAVCSAGNVDDKQCKKFITNLAIRAGAFSWKDDIVFSNATSYGTYVDLEGNRPENAAKAEQIANSLSHGLTPGEWLVQFSWMTENSDGGYTRRYPGYEYIRGTSACVSDQHQKKYGTKNGELSNNGGRGSNTSCWCKITEPVTTPWVFFEPEMVYSGGTRWDGAHKESCAKGCAKLCQSRLRSDREAKEKTFAVVSDKKDTQDLLYVSQAADVKRVSSSDLPVSRVRDNLNSGYYLENEDGTRNVHDKLLDLHKNN